MHRLGPSQCDHQIPIHKQPHFTQKVFKFPQSRDKAFGRAWDGSCLEHASPLTQTQNPFPKYHFQGGGRMTRHRTPYTHPHMSPPENAFPIQNERKKKYFRVLAGAPRDGTIINIINKMCHFFKARGIGEMRPPSKSNLEDNKPLSR